MAQELPEPLVPADVDLRDMDGFMLNVERLFASELWALSTGEEFKAAVGLWGRAWKQVPAASLPNDDRVLAAFAGVALSRWKKVRAMAIHGFIECSDGRLYHRVLSEDALRAWGLKLERRTSREADKRRLKRWREDRARAHETGDETRFNEGGETADETRFTPPGETRTKRDRQDRTGQDSKEEEPSPTTEPPPEKPKLKAAAAKNFLAFEGQVVRLKPIDFDRWKAAFHAIPDIVAELTAIDAKFAESPPKNWFVQCSAWLRTKHERLLAERVAAKADAEKPKPRQGEPGWKSPVDGWVPGQL